MTNTIAKPIITDMWAEIEVQALGIDVPKWIDQDIMAYDVAAIVQGGCASGAYMPAVIYFTAGNIMAKHGDTVLDYLDSYLGELPTIPDGSSWSGIAVFYLSCAVECWAVGTSDQIEEMI